MTEYGYYSRRRQKTKKKNSFLIALLRIVDVVMWGVLILITLLLVMAMLARYINPNSAWAFAFAGLMFPLLFIGELLVALYWIVRWRYPAFIALGFVLICLPDARMFYKPSLLQHYEQSTAKHDGLLVMSYNVMGFTYGSARSMVVAERIAKFVAERGVDILCLQEFNNKYTERFDKILNELKYHYVTTYSNPVGAKGIGVAIYSRYPILESGVIDAQKGIRRSIWADLKVKSDTIRVLSNHLQNTNIGGGEEDYVTEHLFREGQMRVGQLQSIVSKLRKSYCLRAQQADSIARAVSLSPHLTIVCGDFNDTPLSYTHHTIAHNLRDSYVARGEGAVGTYHGFFNMFRIDYILYSRGLQAIRFEASEFVMSDHNPIMAEFLIDDTN